MKIDADISSFFLLRKQNNEDLVLLKLNKYKMGSSILLIVNPLGSTRAIFFYLKQKCVSLYLFFSLYIYSLNSLKHFIYYFFCKNAIFKEAKINCLGCIQLLKPQIFSSSYFLGQNILLALKVLLIFSPASFKTNGSFYLFFLP